MSQTFLPKILEQKAKEVSAMELEKLGSLRQTYSFYDYLKSHSQQMQVIAEVKKASPSLGDINLGVDIVSQAKAYKVAGAAMISVLTDEHFFKGKIDYLRQISSQVSIPTLAKDFIIDEKQIVLIVAALTRERLQELYQYATGLGLEVLVETHNAGELAVAHALGAKIIGVNNRNLVTFKTDLQTSLDLADHFHEEPVYISESAIQSGQDVSRIAPYFDGILVGTALMTAADPAQKIKELRVDKG